MRPMRLGKRAVTDPARIRKIIEDTQVLRIGAQDAGGMFIVPVNFGFSWLEGSPLPSFYVHSAHEGRKAEAFSHAGATVAIELDCDRGNITGGYSCSYSRSYASIMGTGTVRKVEDDAERRYALELIMAHAAPEAPVAFTAEGLLRVAIFRIDPIELSAKERLPKVR